MGYRRVFLALVLCVSSGRLHAQSFDCKKATTPVEKLICATPDLQTLDSSLDDKVQRALNASLAERAKLLAEERRWLSERDKKCAVSAGTLAPEQRARSEACLAEAYRARIAAVERLIEAQEAARPADKALCQRIVDSYQRIIAADPKAFFGDRTTNPPSAENPFTLLARTPGSGVERTPAVGEVAEPSAAKLDGWAKSQKPPFRIPDKVKEAMLEDTFSTLIFERAAGTNFYAASTTQGTAHCIVATYFEVKDGVALRAGTPPWGDGDSCGVEQFFGTVDGRTVAIEDIDNLYRPSISDRLTVMAWEKGFFRAPCTIDFEYEPAFADSENENAESPEEKCESPACLALKAAARALVEDVQRHPLEARRSAIDRLTAAQRASFEAMEKLAPKDPYGDPPTPEQAADPASYREDGPLRAPLLQDGEVYLASVGHVTMGWRDFADWSVKLARLDNGRLKPIGVVYVAMAPARLRKATVR